MNSSQKSLIRQIFEGAPGGSINMALGEPVFNRPAWFDKLLTPTVLNRFSYSPNAGYAETRDAVLNLNGYPGKVEDLCLTCGAEEGLFATLSGIRLEQGSKGAMLAPDPFFLTYPTIASLLGMRFDSYSLPAWSGCSLYDAVAENIREDTQVVIINSPGNPAGNMVDIEDLHRVENLCAEKNIFLLVDEVYRFFGNETRPVSHSWEELGSHTICVSSVTKIFGLPGLRLGWAFTRHPLMQNIIAAHQSITAISPTPSQQIVAEFPAYDYSKWLKENRDKTIRNRNSLMAMLDDHGLEYIRPEGAFYLLLKVPEAVLANFDDVETAFALRDEFSVLVVPGSAFGANARGTLRLSFGGAGDDFPEAVRRIHHGFEKLSKS